jgi:hypothetical protein
MKKTKYPGLIIDFAPRLSVIGEFKPELLRKCVKHVTYFLHYITLLHLKCGIFA